ncbi:MAG: hypothetical protein QW548_00810 [Candidatus Aenigmatarchaeota archaeon]
MIDWFASKVGLLIFVTVAAAALLSFFLAFSSGFTSMSAAAVATDIARLIDSTTDGASVIYAVPLRSYTLGITGRLLVVNGIERGFLSSANSTTIASAAKLKIERIGDVVYVSPV